MAPSRVESLAGLRISRRSFLAGSLGSLSIGLLSACGAPSAPPAPTGGPAAPAAAQPTAAAAGSAAKPAGQVVLRFGTSTAEGTTQVAAMRKFGDELGKLSSGGFKVEVYPSSQLGTLREMIENTQLGTLQMTLQTPAGAAPLAPKLDVMSLLFLAGSPEKLFAGLDGAFGQRLDKEAQAAGIKILGWWYAAPRQFCNNRHPINTPDDLKGLKIRVINSPVWVSSIQALGANPIALDFSEIYNALQQNVIDGYENLATDVYTGKFYEVVKYMSLSAHLYDTFVVFMNKKLWDGFSSEQQQMVSQAVKVATDWQRPAQTAAIDDAQNKLRSLMTVNEISEANRKLFKDKVQSTYSSFAKTLGQDLIDDAIKALG